MKHKLIDLLNAADQVLLVPEDQTASEDLLAWYDGDGTEDCGEDCAFLENDHEDRYAFIENELVDLDLEGRAVVTLNQWYVEDPRPRVLQFLIIRPMLDSDVGEKP